jgi:Putative zinc-finger
MPRNETESGFTCREVVDLAADYVEGAMNADDASLFEVHLNYCDGCVVFVNQIRTAAGLASRVTEEDVSDDLKAKLLTAFRDWKGV